MPLHIDRSTVGMDAPLAPLAVETDPVERRGQQADAAPAADTDSASISASGQRLAQLRPADQSELDAVNAADDLVRNLLSQVQANPQAAQGAHQGLDPNRVARLLQ